MEGEIIRSQASLRNDWPLVASKGRKINILQGSHSREATYAPVDGLTQEVERTCGLNMHGGAIGLERSVLQIH